MFGGWGLYVDDLFVALIFSDRLYLKADATTAADFAAAGGEPFVYDGKGKTVTVGYWSPPAEAMDSPELMLPWGRLALAAALRARKPRKTAPIRRAARKSATSPKAAATSAATSSAAKKRRPKPG
jgi:DNA transformation protein and related proteins